MFVQSFDHKIKHVILLLSHINISIFPKLHIFAQFGPLYCIVLYCIDILMYYTAVSYKPKKPDV